MIALWVRHVKGAILISIVVTTVVAIIVEAIGSFGAGGAKNPTGWGLNVPKLPDKIIDTPDFGTLGHFNLFGSFASVGVVAAILLIFTLMLADFFDTMGTMTAIGAEAGLLDEDGIPPNTQQHPGRRLARRRRRWRRGCLLEHLLHRVGLRRRRRCPHRTGLGRHRRALPARDLRCRRWSR